MGKDIKVIVAAHKKYEMPKDKMYVPVQVGAEGKKDIGYTKDNTGDNISSKNSMYCELTGLYWAWKNLDADYIGLALIKNFFLVTIGYVLLLAGIAAYFSEYLMDNVNKINLVAVGIYVIVGYLIVLIAYSVLTYIQYSVKYYRAKKSVKEYYQDLTRLEKIYGREEKRTPARRNAGGHRK